MEQWQVKGRSPVCFLNGDKTDRTEGMSAWDLPNVPGEVFASAEDHATLAITSALKGLCRGRAVAFCDAGGVGWGSGEDGGMIGSDEGSHVRGRG